MKKLVLIFGMLMTFSGLVGAQTASNVAGTYNAVLLHEGTDFFQFARITLRTTNPDGQIKIAANVRMIFGAQTSNEYLTYEYSDVPYNLVTGQLSIEDDSNDITMIAYIRGGALTGDWFSTLVGYVGTFSATKVTTPDTPESGVLVESLAGLYRGSITNENQQSNLPERVTFSFVTTQENSGGEPSLHISGNTRLYLGDFDSIEYVEIKFSDIQFNYYNRFMTAKTAEYGLTFKGYLDHDGSFDGEVFSDGIGRIGPAELSKVSL